MRAFLVGALAAWSGGCFSPQFDQCAVACGAGDACPPGTVCREDGMCHASMEEPLCTPGREDGGPDARLLDDGGAPDAQVGDAGPPVTPTMAGQLVISEALIDVEGGVASEPGEWFEIHNPSDSTSYDLFGLRVDGEQVGETFSIDTSLVIAPGEQLLFARTDGIDGLAPDFIYGDTVQLGNTSGEIELIYPLGDVLIDRLPYGSGPAGWPRAEGSSISLAPDQMDAVANDDPGRWCEGTTQYTTEAPHQRGTPGAPNPPCG